MSELPSTSKKRALLNECLQAGPRADLGLSPPSRHIALGLALTVGSALGQVPPSPDQCLESFIVPNSANLTAGARAWSKHAHRSASSGWWGRPRGPVASINAGALELFSRIMQSASWRNLHWLPHMVLVYEIRVEEGYGMRWSQDQLPANANGQQKWVFRGFVEPMMENGHELQWRH